MTTEKFTPEWMKKYGGSIEGRIEQQRRLDEQRRAEQQAVAEQVEALAPDELAQLSPQARQILQNVAKGSWTVETAEEYAAFQAGEIGFRPGEIGYGGQASQLPWLREIVAPRQPVPDEATALADLNDPLVTMDEWNRKYGQYYEVDEETIEQKEQMTAQFQAVQALPPEQRAEYEGQLISQKLSDLRSPEQMASLRGQPITVILNLLRLATEDYSKGIDYLGEATPEERAGVEGAIVQAQLEYMRNVEALVAKGRSPEAIDALRSLGMDDAEINGLFVSQELRDKRQQEFVTSFTELFPKLEKDDEYIDQVMRTPNLMGLYLETVKGMGLNPQTIAFLNSVGIRDHRSFIMQPGYISGGITWEKDYIPENMFKDAWDALSLEAARIGKSSLEYMFSTLPRQIFKDYPEDTPVISQNKKNARDKFRQVSVYVNSQFEDWVEKKPELRPKPAFEKPFDINRMKEPDYLLYQLGKNAAFSGGLLAATLGVGFLTKNPYAAMGTAWALATPSQAQDVYEDLLASGATEDQAAQWSIPVGLAIGGLDAVGEYPLLAALSPVFNTLRRKAQQEIIKRTALSAIKKGITTFGTVEATELITENMQNAIQNAFASMYDENRNVFDNAFETTMITALVTAPYAFIGGGSTMLRIGQNEAAAMSPEERKSLTRDEKTGEWFAPVDIKALYDQTVAKAQKAGLSKDQAVLQGLNQVAMTEEGASNITAEVLSRLQGITPLSVQAVQAGRLELQPEKPEVTPAPEVTITKEEAMKFANPEKPYIVEEIYDKGLTVNTDGTMTLYHATTKERAEQLIKNKTFKTAEGAPDAYGVYFSTSPEVAESYGDGTLVKVRVKLRDLNLDDSFPGRPRMDFQVNTKGGIFTPVSLEPLTPTTPAPAVVQEPGMPEAKPAKVPSERARQIQSELEADISIARKKIADIKTPLPTQGADVQFARLALNDAERLLKQNQTLINRIERGKQVSQAEIDALNDELASVKDALKFQIKDVAKARTYLTRYVSKNVPLAERGKLLTAISKIQGAQDIDAVVRRANELAEQSEKRQLRTDIIKELKRAKPRKVEGIVKGRFGGDIQAELDIMNRSLKMTRDDALTKIQANQQAYESGVMSYEDMVKDNARLNFTGIEGMTATELQDTLDYIKTLKGEGRVTRIAELEKWKEGIDKAKADITKVVTGGKEVEPEVIKEFTGFKGLLKRIERGQVALTDFLDILSGTDKSSKPYSSDLNLFVDDRVIKSYNAEQDGLVATGDTVRDNFKRVFNITKDRQASDILRRLGKEKVNLGTFQNTEGKSVKLELTKGQMIDVYNLMQSAENLPTFTEGNKFTQEMRDAISNGLTTQEKAWADWQRSFLADYWTGINNIYEPLYGVKLGRNENYWPRNRDIERSDVPEHILVQEDYNHFASVTNGSLKARTQNKIPFKFLDANTKLLNHVTQMEHFKAWANTIRDLRSVFMSRDIKNAIHQFYGREIGNKIDDYISILARGGIEKAKRVHILDTLRGNVAVSVLGIKPMIALKQPTALLAYATEMPYGDFISGVANFLKNPVANYKTLYEKSASLRARYRAGQYERDIKVGVEGGVPTNLSGKANWKERVLTLIQLGDQFGTVPGMWAKYQSELKAGATDAQAILEAEKLTNRTQNTSQLFTLTSIQHGGSWARLATMFQDQPNKYFRLINSNFRNMINGRQGVAKSVSNIALLWVVIPVLFQWMSDAFQWRPERQLRAAALGPVNMLLIIGQAAQSVVGWATGEKYPYEPSPVLQIADDIQATISKMRKLIADGQDPFKDVTMDDVIDMVEFFVKSIGMTTGVPTPYLVQLERMARGQEGKQDLRELLFSRWALEEPKPDLNEKSNDARLKLGLLKEPTGKEDTDKLPEISNTADYFNEQKKNFSKTLPGDITEKKGFDRMAVVVGQAFVAEDKYLSQPNKALYKIVDDMEKDESINYTVTQYYLDWQTRSKITSLAKLKEFDDTHPRAYLGNLTPEQLALLVEYENTPKEQRKQFLLDHEGLKFQPRHEWLKSHPKENAQLAVWGQAKILTKEAYNEFKRLVDELDIPDNAIPPMLGEKSPFFQLPEQSVDNYLAYQNMENKNSWEAQLMLAKDPDLLEFLERQPIDTPIASLELKVKNRDLFDKLDAFSDRDSPDYIADEKARAEAIKKFRTDNPEFVDDTRRIEAIEKGTDENPIDEKLVSAHVEYGKLIDEEGIGSSSAEAMLYRVDNPDYDKWRQDTDIWGDQALTPIDQSRIPIWRIDVKYATEDAEYNAIKNLLPSEQARLRAEYMDTHEAYRKDNRRREAYGLTNSKTGYKFPTTEVENYVAYNELSIKGKRRDRFLVDNSEFANALYDVGQIVDLPDPAKVPAVQFDDIYDQFSGQFDEIEKNGQPESGWFEPDPIKRAARDNELRFDPTGKYTEFGLAEIRRNAYGLFVPENYVNDYVGYYTIIGQGKPADADYWYEDDWYLLEHPSFYKQVYLGVLGNQKRNFGRVPTRKVYQSLLTYNDLSATGKDRLIYRHDNQDLENYLVNVLGYTPVGDRWMIKISPPSQPQIPSQPKIPQPPQPPKEKAGKAVAPSPTIPEDLRKQIEELERRLAGVG